MASSRKKRSRAVVTLLLCLAAVCIVAALVLYGLTNRKLKALQQGADFEFTYAVTSQGGTTHPALYSILDQAGATEGRMTGLYSPASCSFIFTPAMPPPPRPAATTFSPMSILMQTRLCSMPGSFTGPCGIPSLPATRW